MDTVINAAYILRYYAWEILKRNYGSAWDEANYDGLVPIVPLGEAPELQEFSNHPHIVYGYVENPMLGNHFRRTGAFTLSVYDSNFRRLTKTMNILLAAFERHDETARDVNKFSSEYSPDGVNIPLLGLRFGYIRVALVQGGEPEETEGGNQNATITISYEYYVEHDVITTW